MNKRREFRFAVLDKKQFYKYIHDKVDFFTEDETWERTNEVGKCTITINRGDVFMIIGERNK